MYGLVDMRTFFFTILLPATALLYGIAGCDRLRGDRRLWRAVMIGTLAGLIAAVAYDIFRLPFVFADAWGLSRFGIPQMPLFKVFPRFGALILGQSLEQPSYSLAAQVIGWGYHFSNGATFGVMFASVYAGAQEAFAGARRNITKSLACATIMAVGIELCLLASPYAPFFGIQVTPQFIAVTLLAHLIFGIALGAAFAGHAAKWRLPRLVPVIPRAAQP